MRFKQLLLLLAVLWAIVAQTCQPLCTQPCSGGTCSECFADFSDNSTTSSNCNCPQGMFLNTTTSLCNLCPITCSACSDASTCSACITGYMLSNSFDCIEGAITTNGWVSKAVSQEVTDNSTAVSNFFLLSAQNSSLSVNLSMDTTPYLSSCSMLGDFQWLGGYQVFSSQSKVVKSAYGLPPHDWINVRMQVIAIDQWEGQDLNVMINANQSYDRTMLSNPGALWSVSFNSSMRFKDFCGDSAIPDNLAVVDAWTKHNDASVQISVEVQSTNSTSLFFGVREVLIRVGTCGRYCQECDSPSSCLVCKAPYELVNSTCTCGSGGFVTETGGCEKNCLSGTYYNSTATTCMNCENMLNGCQTCNFTHCHTCSVNFFHYTYANNSESCVRFCPSGSTQSQQITVQLDSNTTVMRPQCTPCMANCSICTSQTCLSCLQGFVFYMGSCQSSCPTGWVVNGGNCQVCPFNCETCSVSACQVCSSGYKLMSGVCQPFCNGTMTVSSSMNNSCMNVTCDLSCEYCFGPDNNQCTSCSNMTYLYMGECIPSCAGNTFTQNNECKMCPSACSMCNSSSSCSQCANGYFLNSEGNCNRFCPTATFPASPVNSTNSTGGTCESCEADCQRCIDANTCIACVSGKVLFDFNCLGANPAGYQVENSYGHLKPCPSNCDSCRNKICLRCAAGYYRNQGECLMQCPTGKFKKIRTRVQNSVNVESGFCEWDSPLCMTYDTGKTDGSCLECSFLEPSLVLFNSSGVNKCGFSCPQFQGKTTMLGCSACPNNCRRCNVNMECLECISSHVINAPQILSSNSSAEACLHAVCLSNYFSDSVQCQPCPDACTSCLISGKCHTCMTGFTLDPTTRKCYHSSCTLNQAFSGSCVACTSPCLTCKEVATQCTSCIPPSGNVTYYLNLATKVCTMECPTGYFKHSTSQSCRKCNPKCSSCDKFGDCTGCSSGFNLLDFYDPSRAQCVAECPIGFWSNNQVCARCYSDCKSCYGPSKYQCLSCYPNFYLDDYECVWRCSPGMYKDKLGHCDWCDSSCQECYGPTRHQCITCAENFYWHDHRCFQYSCPSATYLAIPSLRLCERCQFGCTYCTSPQFCQYCFGGYKLYKGWCYTECPGNLQPTLYFFSNIPVPAQGTICDSCLSMYASSCLECDSTSCSRCSGTLYLYRNSTTMVTENSASVKEQCLAACPMGTFPKSSINRECSPCRANCAICSSYSQCTTCSTGFFLINGYCSASCPSGQYRSGSGCINCPSMCRTCTSATLCTSCNSTAAMTYYLLRNATNSQTLCQSSCPTMYYPDSSGWCLKCLPTCSACSSANNCSSCQLGYTLVNNICKDTTTTVCPSPCLTCDGTNCLSCEWPSLLIVYDDNSTSTCVRSCPAGYYSDFTVCEKCKEGCSQCSQKSDNCTACQEGLYLHRRKCLYNCPVSFYPHSNSTCQACPNHCLTCDMSQCTSCQQPYKLYNSACHLSCPQTTYLVATARQCFDCPQYCASCASTASCTSCISNYYLYQQTCSSECPQTTYPLVTGNSGTCQPCTAPCYTCESSTACLTCIENYIIQGTTCQASCDQGHYMYTENVTYSGEVSTQNFSFYSQCLECEQGCASCIGQADNCQSCLEDFLLYGDSCLTECPLGTYEDWDLDTCLRCSAYCSECLGPDSCLQCSNGAALFEGICLDECPQGYYAALETDLFTYQFICESCSQACDQCDGPSEYECKDCAANYYLLDHTLCVAQCPAGEFANDATGTCIKCVDACSECYSLTNCSVCASGFTLTGTNQCIPPTQTCNISNCLYCDDANSSKCLQCQPSYYLYNHMECVEACPSVTYEFFGECWPCDANCSECDFWGCTTCMADFYLFNEQCWSTCPFLTYPEGNQCILDPCLFYNPFDSQQCLLCIFPFVLYTVDNSSAASNYSSECLLFCPASTTQIGGYCISCPENCMTCFCPSVCSVCQSGYTLHQGECFHSCPLGMYSSGEECHDCSLAYCDDCSYSNMTEVCEECDSQSFLLNGVCYITCPTGYYGDSLTGHCQMCESTCSSCRNATHCTACNSGSYLIDGQCDDQCPIGTYLSGSECVDCSMGCYQCSSATLCQACFSNYALSSTNNITECVSTCPSGYFEQVVVSSGFINSLSFECTACVSPCLTCTTYSDCTSCQTGFSLSGTYCLIDCYAGYYSVAAEPVTVNGVSYSSFTCEPCSAPCLTCRNSSTTCETCPSGYLLDNENNCISNCVNVTTYYDQTTRQCYACSQLCYSCSGPSSQECLSCLPPLQLYQRVCVTECPYGYHSTFTYQCHPCSPLCADCSLSSTNCTLCHGDQLLEISTSNVGQCVNDCSIGKYLDQTYDICQNCNETCRTCTGPLRTQCISCMSGFLVNGECKTACDAGSTPVVTATSSTCQTCPDDCLVCVYMATSETVECSQCDSDFYLVSGSCEVQCPDTTYPSPFSYSCLDCGIVGCQQCFLNTTFQVQCTTCQGGYYLLEDEGTCETNCPSGFTLSGSICQPNKACTGYEWNGNCLTSCPTGTYASSTTVNATTTRSCVNCPTFCLSCSGPSACHRCEQNTYLITQAATNAANSTINQTVCISSCPSQHYVKNGTCLSCPSSCQSCVLATTGLQCLSCTSPGLLLDGSCVTTCPNNYYESSGECKPCAANCAACEGTATNCTICKNNNLNLPACTTSNLSCTSNQYADSGMCKDCDPSCQSCFGGQPYECLTCLSGQVLSSEGACVANCPSRYARNGSECEPCPSLCQNCTVSGSQVTCDVCNSGYLLSPDGSQCVVTCSQLNTAINTYYLQSGTCTLCSISDCILCQYSMSQVTCAQCDTTAYAYNGLCYTMCPNGTYGSDTTMTCMACSSNCTSCSASGCSVCQGGFYLNNGQCSSSCSVGNYPDANTSSCTPCSAHCQTCTSAGCSLCQQPYFLSGTLCTACIDGYYYSASSTCLLCSSQCQTCSGSSAHCLTCDQDMFMLNNNCYSTCPSGYYSSGNNCLACSVADCQTCTATACSVCNADYSLLNLNGTTSCVSSCPTATYLYAVLGSCFNCAAHCDNCTSATMCTLCTSGYYLYQGYCLSQCPTGFTISGSDCVACPSTCRSCSATTNCTTCESGLSLDSSGTCVQPPNNCTTGYYLNSMSTCEQCFPSCHSCSAGLASSCLSCFNGSTLTNGVCIKSCNSDEFYNTATSQCESCSKYSDCESCNQNSCEVCSTGFTLSAGVCSMSCPNGTYLSSSQCLFCPSFCSMCTSSTHCTSCTSASIILYNDLCYTTCPAQTYESGGTCLACYQTCLYCSGSATNCSSCITPYSLHGNSCEVTCPTGTYSENYTCLNCSLNCLQCSSASECTNCSSGFLLLNGTCRDTCPTGYYHDTSSDRCLQCVLPCTQCSSRTNCSACQSPYLPSGDTCISNCSTGQYWSSGLAACANCSMEFCGFCSDTTCFNCQDGYYKAYVNGVFTNCVNVCLNNTYSDNATGECENCFTNCASCTSGTICTSCDSNYHLLTVSGASANECVDVCPLGYYEAADTSCQACSSNCNVCTDTDHCTTCAGNYYKYRSSSTTIECVDSCPSGYYTPTQVDGIGECGLCGSNCAVCSDAVTCTQCSSSIYVVYNGVCTPSNCLNCLTCDSTNNACLRCEVDYYLYDSACTSNCPNGFYPDNSTTPANLTAGGTCSACMTDCLVCDSATNCLVCINGYTFVEEDGSCQNQGLVDFGRAGNMSGFTSNITQVVATVYVATSSGPMAFGAMQSTYGVMQFCQMMNMLQGSTDDNQEMNHFLNSLSVVSYTTGAGTQNSNGNGSDTLTARRRLTAVDYRASFLETNMPIFIIMGCFISFYIFVVVVNKWKESCCASCPCLLKYMGYICGFMEKRFKYIYVDIVMWISYIPFLYFSILQLKAFSFASALDGFSSFLAMVIIAVYPLYPLFIIRKLFDRCDDPNEDLVNYKAYTLKLPLDEEEEAKKGCCDDFQWCPVASTEEAMVEMSLSPYISHVKRPVYNEDVPQYSEFKYCSIDHWRLIVIPLTYLRKFIFVLVVALTSSPVVTLGLLIGITVAFIVYLIVFKPKEKLYLVFELIFEFLLLVFLIFMLTYVIIGGGTVTVMSIVTHAVGFAMANSSLIIAIILNIMAYYTIFCCIVDMVRYLKAKVEEDDIKEKKMNELLNPGQHISDFDPRDPGFHPDNIDFDEKEDFFIDPEVRNELPSEIRDQLDAQFDEKVKDMIPRPRGDDFDPNDDIEKEKGLRKPARRRRVVDQDMDTEFNDADDIPNPDIEWNDKELGDTSKVYVRGTPSDDIEGSDMGSLKITQLGSRRHQPSRKTIEEPIDEKESNTSEELGNSAAFKSHQLRPKGRGFDEESSGSKALSEMEEDIEGGLLKKQKDPKYQRNVKKTSVEIEDGQMRDKTDKYRRNQPQKPEKKVEQTWMKPEQESEQSLFDPDYTNRDKPNRGLLGAREGELLGVGMAERNPKSKGGKKEEFVEQGRPYDHEGKKKRESAENSKLGGPAMKERQPKQTGMFDDFEEIGGDPTTAEAATRQRRKKEKEREMLKDRKGSEEYGLDANLVERQPNRKGESAKVPNASEEQQIGDVHAYERKKDQRRRNRKSRQESQESIDAVGKERAPKKLEKIHSQKEYAEDEPDNLTIQQRQKRQAAKPQGSLFDKVMNDPLAESVEVVVNHPPGKAPKDDPFEEEGMGKPKRGKKEEQKRGKGNLNLKEGIEESYDDVVQRSKQQVFKPGNKAKDNLLELDEDQFEEQGFKEERPRSKAGGRRRKDGGLGMTSNDSEVSDSGSIDVRRKRAEAKQRLRNKGHLGVNDSQDEEDNSSIASDVRRVRGQARKRTKSRSHMMVSDNSDAEDIGEIKLQRGNK